MPNFFTRRNDSRSPKGTPSFTASQTPGAYYTPDPTIVKSPIGYCWYPGVRYATALGMHNHVPMAQNSPANLNLAPPTFSQIGSFGVQPRSVIMGARFNARYSTLLTQRVIMPQVSMR